MPTLSWWEQLIIGMTITALTELESKITNATVLAALQAAVTFLGTLLNGQTEKPTTATLGAKLHAFMKKAA